jgi:hypothetical protein
VDPALIPVLGGFTGPTVHAVDFAPKHDFTARVSVQAREGRLVLAGHRIWKPTPGEPMDLEETVERDLRECYRRGHCVAIVCDPYQMHGSITQLQKAGLPITEVAQTVSNTTAFSQALYDALKGRSLRMYYAADLREQALNVVALETGRGWRLAKEKTSRKIDAIVAMAMAVHTLIEELAKPDLGPSAAVVLPGELPPKMIWRERWTRGGVMHEKVPFVEDPHWRANALGRRPEETAAEKYLREFGGAPMRATPSDAMLECREQRRQALERDRQLITEMAKHHR